MGWGYWGEGWIYDGWMGGDWKEGGGKGKWEREMGKGKGVEAGWDEGGGRVVIDVCRHHCFPGGWKGGCAGCGVLQGKGG